MLKAKGWDDNKAPEVTESDIELLRKQQEDLLKRNNDEKKKFRIEEKRMNEKTHSL